MNITDLFTLTDWIIVSIGTVLMILIPSLIVLGLYTVAAWLVRRISGILLKSPAAEAVTESVALAAPAEIEAEWADIEQELAHHETTEFDYDVPVIYRAGNYNLQAWLTVFRRIDHWEGRIYWPAKMNGHPDLYKSIVQAADEPNGRCEHLSHRQFLENVQFVFGHSSDVHFSFSTEDFEPWSVRS